MTGKSNDDLPAVIKSQYERLNFFLVSSSFLVAAFITLVTSSSTFSPLTSAMRGSLVFFVALLGYFLAVLHTFMNFWVYKRTGGQTIHTWATPFAFALFWIGAWLVVENKWTLCAVIISLVVLIGSLLFLGLIQILRECIEQRKFKDLI